MERLKKEILKADAIIIGAGAGLSDSAGFVYTGERFRKHFSDFADKYHFADMYSGGFYLYATQEEYWAYWSRYIWLNRYSQAEKPVYNDLLQLIQEKEYFVLTTNVDHQFQMAGFDKQKLFYTQGDYGLFQCSVPCTQRTYDNEAIIGQMVAEEKEMRIPSALVPYCPVCGKPMTMNLRADSTFVEDEGWHKAAHSFDDFIQKHKESTLLLLELGCGMNTPGIVKFRFWQMTHQWENVTYVCINKGEAAVPHEIAEKAICINDDIGEVLKKLL